MARTSRSRWWRGTLVLASAPTLMLAACTDTGIVGAACDPSCAEDSCNGLPACASSCESDDLCREQSLGRYCDPEQSLCVECYRSRHCEDEEHCDDGICVRDDDDEDASQ